jgi:dCTP deaminase
MILSGHTIRRLGIITPHVDRTVINGMSYGQSLAGYDIRAREHLWVGPKGFQLLSSVEYFNLPKDILGVVHDKSSWARKGLSVQNTVLEPGWKGFLTLEVNSHVDYTLNSFEGSPIAQVVFHRVDEYTDGYRGKYQDQPNRPVEAISE